MDTDFTKTKYLKHLIENAETLEKDLQVFNEKINELLNSREDELGVILKCHLIIEHYLDEFIIVAYPTIGELDKIRMTFSQKLEMTNNKRTFVGMSYEAIKSLNTLRNRFSHKLGYVITESDYAEIKKLMKIWNNALGASTPEGLQLIQKFTIWICGNFNSLTMGIKKQTPEIGLGGYLEWLNKMTSS